MLWSETVSKNSKISWNVCPIGDVGGYIPNADRIVRVIGTIYRDVHFYFVELKYLSTSFYEDDLCESIGSCVVVEQNNRLVMIIYPKEIADALYDKFSNAVVASLEGSFLDDFLDEKKTETDSK